MGKLYLRFIAGAILAATACAQPLQASELTVNDGTVVNDKAPFWFYNLDNSAFRSQTIYPAAQLADMKGNAITQIQFYLDDNSFSKAWAAEDMIISLGTTESTSFSSFGTEFVDAEFKECFRGKFEGNPGDKLMTFTFDTPYPYTDGNLVMQVSLGAAANWVYASLLGVETDNYPSAYTVDSDGKDISNADFLPKTTFTYGQLAEYEASVNPVELTFDIMLTGTTATKQVTIKNTGAKELGISVAAPSNDAFTAKAAATTIASGQTTTVDFTFAPKAEGKFNATATIDLGEAGTKTITLAGEAAKVIVGSEVTIDGLIYEVLSTTEAAVSDVEEDVTECTIPAEIITPQGATLKVISIGRDAFYWSDVTKATLPEGITEIGYGAFRSSPLAEVNIPSTVKTVGDYAFYTTKIKTLKVPEGVESIGSSVVASCSELTSIELPSTLKSIGSGAFYKTAISTLDIPAGCTTIGSGAIQACKNLTTVILPEGLTVIDKWLFQDSENLSKVVIPSTVTTICLQSFQNTAVTELSLPAALAKIESNSFNGAPVSKITVADGNTSFKTVDGVLYDAEGNFVYLYPRDASAESYTVADGCRGIIGGSFYKCLVKNVTLPETLVGIDDFAFCLSALENINIPEKVFLIGEQAFAGTNITEMTLPAGSAEQPFTDIYPALFADCAALKTVTIPATVNLLGNRAFFRCTALTEIICLGKTPLLVDEYDYYTDPFFGITPDNVTVYCPDGADILASYMDSDWAIFFKNIKNISERPTSGIGSIEAGEIAIEGGDAITITLGDTTAAVAVFSTDGRAVYSATASGSQTVDSLPAGIYIVRVAAADGSTRTAKVAVR